MRSVLGFMGVTVAFVTYVKQTTIFWQWFLADALQIGSGCADAVTHEPVDTDAQGMCQNAPRFRKFEPLNHVIDDTLGLYPWSPNG